MKAEVCVGVGVLDFDDVESERRSLRLTPLCPAGHLPLKGGDRLGVGARPSLTLILKWGVRLSNLPT